MSACLNAMYCCFVVPLAFLITTARRCCPSDAIEPQLVPTAEDMVVDLDDEIDNDLGEDTLFKQNENLKK